MRLFKMAHHAISFGQLTDDHIRRLEYWHFIQPDISHAYHTGRVSIRLLTSSKDYKSRSISSLRDEDAKAFWLSHFSIDGVYLPASQ